MYKLIKLMFTTLKINRYTKITLLFLLIFVVLLAAIYRTYSLKNNFLFFYRNSNANLKPPNSIIGFAKLIKNETSGSVDHSEYKKYVDDIYKAGTHLLALINDVIDFSKAESSSLIVEKVDLNLNKIIDSCLKILIIIMQQVIYKVMSVFGQADSGYRNEGTGIGLPLSKKQVELMGGTFDIQSEAKLGTAIRLSFFYEEQTCEKMMDF